MNTEKPIWIYTDGSAITRKSCLGTYAAMILFPDGTHQFVAGAAMWTRINRMELTALNAALSYLWSFHFDKRATGQPLIQVLTDSMYVTTCAADPGRRHANRDLWVQFDELRWHFNLNIQHYGRNEDLRQNQADAACTSLRQIFTLWVEKFISHPSFATFEIGRKTCVVKELKDTFKTHPKHAPAQTSKEPAVDVIQTLPPHEKRPLHDRD